MTAPNASLIAARIKQLRNALAAVIIERRPRRVITSEMAMNQFQQPLELNIPSAVIPKTDRQFAVLLLLLTQLRQATVVARSLLTYYAPYSREYKLLENVLR